MHGFEHYIRFQICGDKLVPEFLHPLDLKRSQAQQNDLTMELLLLGVADGKLQKLHIFLEDLNTWRRWIS